MATSYGRSVQIENQEPSKLDQHPGVKKYFEAAQAKLEAGERQNQQEDQRGSQMVKDDSADQEMRPSPEFAAAQDKETFDQRWASEQQAS